MFRPASPIALGLTLFGLMGSAFAEKTMDETPTITVSGTGKVSSAPDIAEIRVGVATQAPTARDALAGNSESMNALHRILKERGVAAKDIQTVQFQVNAQYSQPRPRQPNEPATDFVPRVV